MKFEIPVIYFYLGCGKKEHTSSNVAVTYNQESHPPRLRSVCLAHNGDGKMALWLTSGNFLKSFCFPQVKCF